MIASEGEPHVGMSHTVCEALVPVMYMYMYCSHAVWYVLYMWKCVAVTMARIRSAADVSMEEGWEERREEGRGEESEYL